MRTLLLLAYLFFVSIFSRFIVCLFVHLNFVPPFYDQITFLSHNFEGVETNI